MTKKITRREFLAASAGAVTLGLDGCSGTTQTCVTGPDGREVCALPQPSEAPFDTVVVLMMENRSFDHLLGWLPGADGRQAGLRYADTSGAEHATWPLAPDFQGCAYDDPDHSWQGIAVQYADGRCDGFLQTAKVGDRFPIGYYTQADLPILSVLASNYTTFDNYFCSMMGPTWENRLYQLTGTTQVDMPDGFPKTDADRPCLIETAIFDRVRAAGLTTGYYYFGEPMTGLFKSKRYDDIARTIDRFWEDARRGNLPNVVFVDPDYTDAAEDAGTSNDYHHRGSVLVGEAFVASVYNALKDSPQWGRMVFVLNFDEHGGFYDHVPPPPACVPDAIPPDLKPGDEPGAFDRYGIRVPFVVVSPYSRKRYVSHTVTDQTSVLRFIETRFDLPALTNRDANADPLLDMFDFANPPFMKPPKLPAATVDPSHPGCAG